MFKLNEIQSLGHWGIHYTWATPSHKRLTKCPSFEPLSRLSHAEPGIVIAKGFGTPYGLAVAPNKSHIFCQGIPHLLPSSMDGTSGHVRSAPSSMDANMFGTFLWKPFWLLAKRVTELKLYTIHQNSIDPIGSIPSRTT